MKKVLSILSAIVFLLGAAGYYLAFTITDEQIREEISHVIRHTSKVEGMMSMTFSKQQLVEQVRFTGKKEFIYCGKHYDVLSRHNEGDLIIFHCYPDEKETALFDWFSHGLDHTNSGKIAFKPLAYDWLFEFGEPCFVIPAIKLVAYTQVIIPASLSAEVPTPPPNV